MWFVRDDRLEPVFRPVTPADPRTALDALVAGPTTVEVDGGLSTALTPEPLRTSGPSEEDPTVTVSVTRGFSGLVGGGQQLAVAQVVWTVTQFPGVDGVRFTGDGQALEVPTDDGLTAGPVGRDDYPSITPEPTPPPAEGPPSATSPPAVTSPSRRRPG
ncbi:GerMN domain-containing protein [Blastococcus sp. LR1]|nr:GerMN domain-containing protein [Blastococcus sp. LR1]